MLTWLKSSHLKNLRRLKVDVSVFCELSLREKWLKTTFCFAKIHLWSWFDRDVMSKWFLT